MAQEGEWVPSEYPKQESKVWKIDGKIKYFVDSTMDLAHRNEIIHKTKEYIADNLKFINESNFDDSVYVLIVRDRNEMKEHSGSTVAGLFFLKDDILPASLILSIYRNGYSPLKHELMHLVSLHKWGNIIYNKLSWLSEGLATLADPDADNCEARTFEEKYVYFLQTNRLLSPEDLMFPLGGYEMPKVKVAYAQSAYIVKNLIENYGMDKIKQQWTSSMDCFEEIFGLTFEELILKINNELNEKYPTLIDLDWEKFNQRNF